MPNLHAKQLRRALFMALVVVLVLLLVYAVKLTSSPGSPLAARERLGAGDDLEDEPIQLAAGGLPSFLERPVWAEFPYNDTVYEISEMRVALLVGGPYIVNAVGGELGFATHGYVPANSPGEQAGAALTFACNVKLANAVVAVPANVSVHEANIVRHTRPVQPNLVHPVNVFCTLPADVWAEGQRQGFLDVQLAGSWTFPWSRLVVAGPYDPPTADTLTFCSSSIFFEMEGSDLPDDTPASAAQWHYWFQHLIEFVEYYRLMGVGHFVMYLSRLPAAQDALAWREMAHYARTGLVTWVDFRHALTYRPPFSYHGQNLAQNDCLLRQSRAWQYGFFSDLDELMVLSDDLHGTHAVVVAEDAFRALVLKEFRQRLATTGGLEFYSVNFYGAVCDKGQPLGSPVQRREGLLLPELHWRMSNYSFRSPKYVVKLSSTGYASTHSFGIRNGDRNKEEIAPETAVMFHYRLGVINVPTRCEHVVNDTEAIPLKYADARVARGARFVYDTQLADGLYVAHVGRRVAETYAAIYGAAPPVHIVH